MATAVNPAREAAQGTVQVRPGNYPAAKAAWAKATGLNKRSPAGLGQAPKGALFFSQALQRRAAAQIVASRSEVLTLKEPCGPVPIDGRSAENGAEFVGRGRRCCNISLTLRFAPHFARVLLYRTDISECHHGLTASAKWHRMLPVPSRNIES